jgi:hypothetical protein
MNHDEPTFYWKDFFSLTGRICGRGISGPFVIPTLARRIKNKKTLYDKLEHAPRSFGGDIGVLIGTTTTIVAYAVPVLYTAGVSIFIEDPSYLPLKILGATWLATNTTSLLGEGIRYRIKKIRPEKLGKRHSLTKILDV